MLAPERRSGIAAMMGRVFSSGSSAAFSRRLNLGASSASVWNPWWAPSLAALGPLVCSQMQPVLATVPFERQQSAVVRPPLAQALG